MKQLAILIALMFAISSCKSRDRVDLEQISLDTKVDTILSGVDKYREEPFFWRYPNYLTYDIENFSWGDINFTLNGLKGRRNRVNFTMDSTNSRIILIHINLHEEKLANRVLEQLKKKYGEAVLLKEDIISGELNYVSYLWKNVKNNQSLIWSIYYYELNEKRAMSMNLNVIRNNTDIVGQDYDYQDMNALEYLIMQESRWELNKIKEVLQQ